MIVCLLCLFDHLLIKQFHSFDHICYTMAYYIMFFSFIKKWKEVETALKRDFSAECAPSQVMRFICYVLKVEPYGTGVTQQ